MLGISHMFEDNIKLSEERILYSSVLNVVYNKHTVYVCSSYATGDLMLIAVDQKDSTDYPSNHLIGSDCFQIGALTIKMHDKSFSEPFKL